MCLDSGLGGLGNDPEATQAAAVMVDFQGYALWE
jgi:hypothetical protein